MQDVLDMFFTQTDILTPKVIIEFFVLCVIFEMVGTIIGYFKGVR